MFESTVPDVLEKVATGVVKSQVMNPLIGSDKSALNAPVTSPVTI